MKNTLRNAIFGGLIGLAIPGIVSAQIAPEIQPEDVDSLYPGKAYSPWAERPFPSRVYWGETHLHTGLSLDAGLFGNTTGHDTAYRLARGEEVISAGGQPVKLSRPLDFLVITDHSDLMGIATDIQSGAPNIVAVPKGKEWAEGFAKGGQAAAEAAFDLIGNFSQGTIPVELLEQYSPGATIYDTVWDRIVEAAEEYNEPGRFTAFIGFEWTSVPKGFNLHRNVILRDGGNRAGQVIPMTTQPPVGSQDPLDLYKWLDDYEEKTGGQALAIAHNGNLSNGWMFPVDRTYAGGRVNKEYVTLRAKWEPLYEVTQIKGDGETHPALSPDDEFADYGTWDVGNLDITELKKPEMLPREYAREALKQGLALEKKFGTNPYKFGMVGATDAHTSLTTAEEDNFFGKSTSVEPSPARVEHPFVKSALGAFEGDMLLASGYQGIWATENTRAALLLVRFFGGWDFGADDLRNRQPAFLGYQKGVPMGGDLTMAPSGKAPTFMMIALRDPIGANLDRIQIVKGWMDSRGDLQEKVYDVAWSGDRKPDANGKLPPVGNTVDVEAANWTNSIGASELAAVWTDPDFDASESAFYYVRVLEIPTPRWVLYDKVRLGARIPESVELIQQERAYTAVQNDNYYLMGLDGYLWTAALTETASVVTSVEQEQTDPKSLQLGGSRTPLDEESPPIWRGLLSLRQPIKATNRHSRAATEEQLAESSKTLLRGNIASIIPADDRRRLVVKNQRETVRRTCHSAEIHCVAANLAASSSICLPCIGVRPNAQTNISRTRAVVSCTIRAKRWKR